MQKFSYPLKEVIIMAKLRGKAANLIGSWSFLVGLILAVLLGVGFTGSYAATMVWLAEHNGRGSISVPDQWNGISAGVFLGRTGRRL